MRKSDQVKRLPLQKAFITHFLLIYSIPALLIYSLFVVYPFLVSINISFTDWNGIDPNYRYVGFDNFISLTKVDLVRQSLSNTILFTVGNIFGAIVLGLLLALLLDKQKWFGNFVKSAFFIPCVLSSFIIGIIWSYMYQFDGGALNSLFSIFGISQVNWLPNSQYSLASVIITQWWQWTGYSAIIFIANLQNIPRDYYESADLDGANSWRKFWNVTYPLITPAIRINFLFSLIGGLRIFDIIYSLTRGGPGYSTSTAGYAIYSLGFQSGQIGVGSSLGLIVLMFSIMCVILILYVTSKRQVDY
jgi:raffinose/stachyose/melibiose transport system permease protein